MKTAVILLGAGAPNPWDAKLTAEITELIVKDTEFLTTKGQSLGSYIFELLKNFYGRTQDISFETIINSLEALQSYFRTKYPFGGTPNSFNSSSFFFENSISVEEIMNFTEVDELNTGEVIRIKNNSNQNKYPCNDKLKEAGYIGAVINRFLYIIRLQIAKYSSVQNILKHEDLNSKFIAFYSYIQQQGYIPRIYTTNYDRLLPSILQQNDETIFEGFGSNSLENEIDLRGYSNLSKIINDHECPCYYCLHGSIYWKRQFNPTNGDYEFVLTPNQTNLNTTYSHSTQTNPGENTIIQNIVTGYNKLQRISLEPLNAFNFAFAKDCINSDMIITIGYSYSDSHINRYIKNAFRTNNPKHLHITFCLEENQLDNEFEKITRDILYLKSDYSERKTTDDKWIISNIRKQMIYFKGFENFLKDDEWKRSNL